MATAGKGKRRLSTSSEAPPSAKRSKLLEHKNLQQQLKLRDNRKNIIRLEDDVDRLNKSQIEFDHTISTVHRFWEQLNEDLIILSQRLLDDDSMRDEEEIDRSNNPLFQLLNPPASKQPVDESSPVDEKSKSAPEITLPTVSEDFEQELFHRCEFTKRVLESVVIALEYRRSESGHLRELLKKVAERAPQSVRVRSASGEPIVNAVITALSSEETVGTDEEGVAEFQCPPTDAAISSMAEDASSLRSENERLARERSALHVKLRRARSEGEEMQEKMIMFRTRASQIERESATLRVNLHRAERHLDMIELAPDTAQKIRERKKLKEEEEEESRKGSVKSEENSADQSTPLSTVPVSTPAPQPPVDSAVTEELRALVGQLELQLNVRASELSEVRQRASLLHNSSNDRDLVVAHVKGELSSAKKLVADQTRQVKELQNKLEMFGQQLEDQRIQDAQFHYKETESLQHRLAASQAELTEARATRAESDGRLAEVRAELEKARVTGGTKFMEEQKLMISAQHAELERIRKEMCDLKTEIGGPTSLNERAVAKKLESDAKSESSAQSEDLESGKPRSVLLKEMKVLKKKEHELRLMIQTLKSESKDSRDRTLLRFSERALLEEKKMMTADNEKLMKELTELKEECSKTGMADFKQKYEAQKETAEQFLSELDSIGQQYSEICDQNKRLEEQLHEREMSNAALMQEKVGRNFKSDRIKEENSTLKKKSHETTVAVKSLNTHVQALEDHVGQLKGETENLRSMCGDLRRQKELFRADTLDKSQRCSSMGAEVTELHRSYAEVLETLRDREKTVSEHEVKTGGLKEDLACAQRKIGILSGTVKPDELVDRREFTDVKMELDHCKRMLSCSVCSCRRNDTIITKCFHLFCSHCVRENLKSRIRKCPRCKKSFGQDDVRSIYWS
eukprot:194637_1